MQAEEEGLRRAAAQRAHVVDRALDDQVGQVAVLVRARLAVLEQVVRAAASRSG